MIEYLRGLVPLIFDWAVGILFLAAGLVGMMFGFIFGSAWTGFLIGIAIPTSAILAMIIWTLGCIYATRRFYSGIKK